MRWRSSRANRARAPRGARSRAAAAAAEVVARPGAGRAGDGLLDRPGGTSRSGRRASRRRRRRRQALCDCRVRPRSARLAATRTRRAGARARAHARPARGGGAGDACVVETLDRHYANEAVREKARWAHCVRAREGSMRFTYYLYVYSWKILFIDDWRVVAIDPPFAFVRCVRAHTGGAREGRARSRRGQMHGGLCKPAEGTGSGPCPWARRAFCC